MLNIPELFDKYDIEYKSSGKNVTSGWIEINCPYSFCSDPSFHCGVNLTTGLHNCWICGNKGGLPKLISIILKISYPKAAQIVKEDIEETIFLPEEEKSFDLIDRVFLPKECTNTLPQPHREYLLSRNFNPEYLIKNFKIKACYLTGDYAYRIIIPIIINNKLACFTSRDITGAQKEKYKHLQKEKSILPIKNCLYNIDAVTDTAIIMEGVFDVWRFGNGAIASFGKIMTSAQIKMLTDKKSIKKVYILYDHEAFKEANKLAGILSPFFKRLEVLDINVKDPAEMTTKEVLELKSIL